jgi:hypothetical protein
VSNPAQNPGPGTVIVVIVGERGQLRPPQKVKSNGTVSSSPPPAPRFPTGIPWKVADDL